MRSVWHVQVTAQEPIWTLFAVCALGLACPGDHPEANLDAICCVCARLERYLTYPRSVRHPGSHPGRHFGGHLGGHSGSLFGDPIFRHFHTPPKSVDFLLKFILEIIIFGLRASRDPFGHLWGGVPGHLPGDPCLLYTSPSPRDRQKSRMPSSA